MTVLFSFKSIYKSYGDDTLFEDLSFDFKNKERLGLIGINGSGKSTFLKLIAKLSQPDDGDIVSKNNINYVYLSQKDNFDPELTIEQTLFKGLSNKVIDEKERHRIIQKSLGTGSFENPETKIKYLSGGWKKRLAIVRALSLKPDILLLDEPTNHLDMNGILWLEKILNNPGFSYIVVSHDRSFLEV